MPSGFNMEIKTEQFIEASREALNDSHARAFLDGFASIGNERRLTGLNTFPDPSAAQDYGAAIRAEAVARLAELLEEFEQNAIRSGAKVFWARNAKEANDFIVRLAQKKEVAFVTKGKSMVSEETGLNQALHDNGIPPYETDLGEFITQLLERPPFHIVGPAVNVPVEDIRDIFLKKRIITEPTLDPVKLGFAARCFLRDKFHHLGMGITGVNMAVAETGTIINVENEGNIRFNKSSPRTQISVMSLEKVVPRMQDALHLLRLLCRNCTGQKISSYVTMDTGPKAADEIDGPEELYIVILDNGRSLFYGDLQAREVLRCIRCGACLGACPVYGKIGGYPYGWAYSGPMGQVLSPLLLGLDKTQNLYRATTLCGRCKQVCPAGIDHPRLYLYYRSKDVEEDPALKAKRPPPVEKRVFRFWKWIITHRWRWSLAMRLLRIIGNRSARTVATGPNGSALKAWCAGRNLPAFPKKIFHRYWKETKSGVAKRAQ